MASSVVRLSPAGPVQEPDYKEVADSIIGELLSRSKPAYTHSDLAEFGVFVQSFDPEDSTFTDSEACLFQPLTQKELEEYKIDRKGLTNEEKRYLLRFGDTFNDFPLDPSDPEHYQMWDRAHQILFSLGLFESRHEKKMNGDIVTIKEASYWDNIKAGDSFYLKTTRPHIKLVTLIGAEAKESELLHGEIGPIANAIQCRVNQPEFENTPIFPVLMLSLFGPRHGRILQAKLDDSGILNVWSSPIYNFMHSDENLKLFVRYNNCKPRDGRELEPLLVEDSPSSHVQYQAPLPDRTRKIWIL
ncbi:hypothetical protein N7461_000891 [Penicillium sp. DV-2018c]|nr:hypothetical protein N7461_000891 [Penicillium sp. DV-2018c]